MPAEPKPSSRKLLYGSVLLGLFVLLDLALLGWFSFRSLSQREIEQVLLETRAEARSLADRLGERIEEEEGTKDLYTVVAVERELQTYIDDVLNKREIVANVEIRDREGKLVFRSTTDAEIPVEERRPLSLESKEIPPNVEQKTVTRRETYDLDVPIGNFGFVHIGINEIELENRIGILREHLLRQTLVIGAVTLVLMALAYLIIWWLWSRGRRLEAKAQEAERMAYIGTLASGLAHEIRNPLNSLNLNMQMLEEEEAHPSAGGSTRKLLSITRNEIGRLERLVTDFLQYAKPRALELEELPASELLQDCRDLLEREAKVEGVGLVVEDRSAGARVAADPEQMSQLLLNLVRNSLAATQGSGRDPEVRLIARRERGRVLLEVLDNGTGIPAAELNRIFEIFYSTQPGGTGLGLAVVQRIASAHGAELSVQSTPNVGTRFQVALPELPAEAAARELPRAAAGSARA
ncbi:MAG: nitrogen regulation protein NR(II) [Thermoanaerobaculia bacterium]